MSGVTLSDLSKYHQGAMKWFKDGLVSEQNRLYAQTEEAGAVSFWPLGGTPLEGKVKFSFKETPPASGDKSPDNPSTIAGVESVKVTRCGANWFSTPYYRNTAGQNNNGTLAWEPNADGTVRLVINNPSSGAFYYMDRFSSNTVDYTYRRLLPVGRYRVSLKLINGTVPSGAYVYMSHYSGFLGDTTTIKNTQYNQEEVFSVSDSSMRHLFIFKIVGNFTADIVVRPVLTILSDADDAIEQYAGNDYTLPLGSTYYGGEIDLATGVMTVTWGATAVTGTEKWYLDSSSTNDVSVFRCDLCPSGTFSLGVNSDNRACSHFPLRTNFVVNTFTTWATSNARVYFRLPASSYPDVDTFKNWLASEYATNHPVTVAYKLNNPQTVQLTPLQLTALTQKDKYTPRVNTVYTDADSIQISYRKSLIHDEDEKVQAIVALGGNV